MRSQQFNYPCADKSTCPAIEKKLSSGFYFFEVWGASGGTSSGNTCGKGGYAKGLIYLRERTTIYINIGAEGGVLTKSSASGATRIANNGGGYGLFNKDIHNYDGGGGGATDIRIINNSLNNRVIVAGGGGGSGYYGKHSKGGDGGGEQADAGEKSSEANYNGGSGGSQSETTTNAFGIGANHPGNGLNAAGGGGGWFGGGYGSGYAAAGGGGSGFVYIKENSLVYLSKKYFLSFTENKKGVNVGDGKVVITKLKGNCTFTRVRALFVSLLFTSISFVS